MPIDKLKHWAGASPEEGNVAEDLEAAKSAKAQALFDAMSENEAAISATMLTGERLAAELAELVDPLCAGLDEEWARTVADDLVFESGYFPDVPTSGVVAWILARGGRE